MHLGIRTQYRQDEFLHHCSSEHFFEFVFGTEHAVTTGIAGMIWNLFSDGFLVQNTLLEYCSIDV
jgi:hypothetical protein